MAQIDLAGKLGDARLRVEGTQPPEDRGLAKFARLTRKDTRIRPDQGLALTALAKTLMKRRAVKAERITENTLIRVAIDLLLTHAHGLRGSTEDELRNSLTPGVSNFAASGFTDTRTPGVPDCRDPAPRDLRRRGPVPDTNEARHHAGTRRGR